MGIRNKILKVFMNDLKFLGSTLICLLSYGLIASGLLSLTVYATEFIGNKDIKLVVGIVGFSLSLTIPFAIITVLGDALTRKIKL